MILIRCSLLEQLITIKIEKDSSTLASNSDPPNDSAATSSINELRQVEIDPATTHKVRYLVNGFLLSRTGRRLIGWET